MTRNRLLLYPACVALTLAGVGFFSKESPVPASNSSHSTTRSQGVVEKPVDSAPVPSHDEIVRRLENTRREFLRLEAWEKAVLTEQLIECITLVRAAMLELEKCVEVNQQYPDTPYHCFVLAKDSLEKIASCEELTVGVPEG